MALLMKIIEAREEHVQVGENDVLVYSHESVVAPGTHVVKLFIGDTEMAYHAPTRGEAIAELGDFFHELGLKLRQMAFLQEGAVRLNDYKARK